MEGPGADLGRVHDHVPAVAGGNGEGVAQPRLGLQVAILGDDELRHAVQVHRVEHLPLVHVADQHLLPQLGDERRGGREALAVDREAVRPVVEDERVLLVERRARLRVLRIDDEGPQQPHPDLLGRVVVRVVHVRPDGLGGELVGEVRPRLDRRLGDERHAVHRERDHLAVEVDRGALFQFVLDDDPYLVALGHADLRAGHHAVVGPGLEQLARLDFPLHLLDGHIEDLEIALPAKFERLAAEPGGLGREGFHARLVQLVHLGGARVAAGAGRRHRGRARHRVAGAGAGAVARRLGDGRLDIIAARHQAEQPRAQRAQHADESAPRYRPVLPIHGSHTPSLVCMLVAPHAEATPFHSGRSVPEQPCAARYRRLRAGKREC